MELVAILNEDTVATVRVVHQDVDILVVTYLDVLVVVDAENLQKGKSVILPLTVNVNVLGKGAKSEALKLRLL